MHQRFLSLFAFSMAGVVGCSGGGGGSSSNGSPIFNAVDTSLTCPAGQIGWDFSTGGGAGQALQAPSNGIHIVVATYGANVGAVSGNWTSKFQTVCDNNASCSRQIFLSSDTDPVYGSAKAFNVQYTCGSEPTIYTTNVAAEAGSVTVALTCGAPMSIVNASFGPPASLNSKPYFNNFTVAAINKCSGLRRCEISNPVGLFGADPAYGQRKVFGFTYNCGTDTTAHQVTVDGGTDPIDFQCPIAQQTGSGPTLNVIQASIALNELGKVDSASIGNATNSFQTLCNGQQACAETLPSFPTIPLFGSTIESSLNVQYSCGAAEPPVSLTLPNASDQSFAIECDAPLTITKASFGANANAKLAGNFTAAATKACGQGIRRCRFDTFPGGPVTGTNLFGSDPASGQNKTWEFDYTCGTDPTLHTQTFNQNDAIDVHCNLQQEQASAAAGIQIDSATYGENCASNSGATVATNNAYSNLVQACLGKDVCNTVFNPASDPAPNCKKTLAIGYHCGHETTPHTVTIPSEAAGQPLGLSCAPLIEIETATYGASCTSRFPSAGQVGDETALLQEACAGTRGSCSYVLPVITPDPAPNCTKDFSINYTCGDDPTVKTQTIAGEAAGKTLALSCPTPANGYTYESCVPQQCTGLQRRDTKLNCVVDNSLLPIPPFSGATTVTTTDWNQNVNETAASGALTFTQDHAALTTVTFPISSTPSSAVTSVQAPSAVANAVLWADDQFSLNSSFQPTTGLPATVYGFRCTVLNTGLLWQAASTSAHTASGLANMPTPNAVSPACFGEDTVPSWADAARRLGLDEATFRTKYSKKGSFVNTSFDDQGQTAALRTASTTQANALVPNPIGFFYHSSSVWEDFISYYQQTTTATIPATFVSSTTLNLAATGGNLRTGQVVVPRSAGPVAPMDIDFVWTMYGDSPGVNPFSPTNPPISANVQTVAQRNLGATVQIASYDDYKAASMGNPQAWVSPEKWMYVDNGPNAGPSGYKDNLLLPSGVVVNSSGKDSHLQVTLGSAARQRIMTPTTQSYGSGFGWMANTTELTHQFAVRVCFGIDGAGASSGAWSTTATLGNGAQQVTFTAKFSNPCYVLPQMLTVVRDLETRPLPYAQPGAYSEGGNADTKGDSSQGTENDTGVSNGCGATGSLVSASNGSPDGGAPVAPDCSQHSSVTSNTMSTGGSFARQIFSLNATTNAKVSGGAIDLTAEAMGFTILDITVNAPFADPTGEYQHELTISPAYDQIAEALDEPEEANPEPVKPAFTPERVHAGDQGIGIGVEAQAKVSVGPVPLVVTVSAGVGVGANLVFDWDSPVSYPCTGNSTCFTFNSTTLSQDDAEEACRRAGGYLAEAVSPADWTGIVAALPSHGQAWIGGESGVTYTEADCSSSSPPNTCPANSFTNFEWLTTLNQIGLPAAFAQQEGAGTALFLPPNGNSTTSPPALTTANLKYFGGPLSALKVGGASPSTPTGLVLAQQATNAPAILASASSNTNPYICEFVPAGSSSSTFREKSTLEIVGAGGVSASVCTPDDAAGLCLAAEINFIEASLGFSVGGLDTTLFSADNKKVVAQKGESTFDIDWTVDFLAGGIDAELHLVFFSISWDIFHYDGVKGYQGTLVSLDRPYSQVYQ